MDPDLFWDKYLLRANDDMLFSCFIDAPKSTSTTTKYVRGIVMGTSLASILACVFDMKVLHRSLVRSPQSRRISWKEILED